MSGGKGRGDQSRDTAAEVALFHRQEFHHTHRVTDAEIVDALRQDLPHLTDPALGLKLSWTLSGGLVG